MSRSRRRWMVLAVVLGLGGVAAYSLRYQIAWALVGLLSPDSPEFRAVEPAPDYTSADAWAVHRPETASGLSVFYVHPTSYIRATTWNQPLSQGRLDRLLFGQIQLFPGVKPQVVQFGFDRIRFSHDAPIFSSKHPVMDPLKSVTSVRQEVSFTCKAILFF